MESEAASSKTKSNDKNNSTVTPEKDKPLSVLCPRRGFKRSSSEPPLSSQEDENQSFQSHLNFWKKLKAVPSTSVTTNNEQKLSKDGGECDSKTKKSPIRGKKMKNTLQKEFLKKKIRCQKRKLKMLANSKRGASESVRKKRPSSNLLTPSGNSHTKDAKAKTHVGKEPSSQDCSAGEKITKHLSKDVNNVAHRTSKNATASSSPETKTDPPAETATPSLDHGNCEGKGKSDPDLHERKSEDVPLKEHASDCENDRNRDDKVISSDVTENTIEKEVASTQQKRKENEANKEEGLRTSFVTPPVSENKSNAKTFPVLSQRESRCHQKEKRTMGLAEEEVEVEDAGQKQATSKEACDEKETKSGSLIRDSSFGHVAEPDVSPNGCDTKAIPVNDQSKNTNREQSSINLSEMEDISNFDRIKSASPVPRKAFDLQTKTKQVLDNCTPKASVVSSEQECDDVSSTTEDHNSIEKETREGSSHSVYELAFESSSRDAPSCELTSNEPDTTTSGKEENDELEMKQSSRLDNPCDLSQNGVQRLNEGGTKPNAQDSSKEDLDQMQIADDSSTTKNSERSHCHAKQEMKSAGAPSTSAAAAVHDNSNMNPPFNFSAFHPLDANATALTAQALLGFNDAITAATASLLKLQSSNVCSPEIPSKSSSECSPATVQSELVMKLLGSSGAKTESGAPSETGGVPSLFSEDSLATAAANAAAVVASSIFRPPSPPILERRSVSPSPASSSKFSSALSGHSGKLSKSGNSFGSGRTGALQSIQTPQPIRASLNFADAAASLVSLTPRLLSDAEEYRQLMASDLSSGTSYPITFSL